MVVTEWSQSNLCVVYLRLNSMEFRWDWSINMQRKQDADTRMWHVNHGDWGSRCIVVCSWGSFDVTQPSSTHTSFVCSHYETCLLLLCHMLCFCCWWWCYFPLVNRWERMCCILMIAPMATHKHVNSKLIFFSSSSYLSFTDSILIYKICYWIFIEIIRCPMSTQILFMNWK